VSVVAGVDFGTLSVRISIFDKLRGKLGSASAEYPLHSSPTDPQLKTQSHDDQMSALTRAMHEAVRISGIDGHEIKSIALDTTGSSVIPVGENLVPLGEYYLWCDHRAAGEAAEITRAAHAFQGGTGFEGIDWCGGVYSSEWGWSKLLHWLRHNPDLRAKFITALEHCDMVAATLCGVTDPNEIPRSVCAMGHKWMWNPRWGGLPPEEFLISIDPLLAGVREKITGHYNTSDKIAGHLSEKWAKELGLTAGIPIPTGAFDAHWDAIGANIRLGDVVNVIGTSTCIIGLSDKQTLVPGVCGVVPGSVDPAQVGIEAGMSAVGDVFAAIARRAGHRRRAHRGRRRTTRPARPASSASPGTTATAPSWSIPPSAASPSAGTSHHTAADELFAAIEGSALHTRVIFNRMEENGAPIRRVINGGGIPKKNAKLNQVYANVLRKPVLVPEGDVTSLGSVIIAFLAAGDFPTIEAAQNALCPPFKTFLPEPTEAARYDRLFPLFRDAYFALGTPDAPPAALGRILPELQNIRRDATTASQ
jgi:L-ribulokinase